MSGPDSATCGARGLDSATCAGLAHGDNYSYCRASELKKNCKSAWPVFFLELSKILEKQWPKVRVFQPSSTLLDNISLHSSQEANYSQKISIPNFLNDWNRESRVRVCLGLTLCIGKVNVLMTSQGSNKRSSSIMLYTSPRTLKYVA